jgi:LysR family glycine cleavage system transcriptional activator
MSSHVECDLYSHMRRQLPSLTALLAFEAAARLGRMTLAANELSVTPGAISRQVTNLEEWMGFALFEGTKARPVLTGAAKQLLPTLTSIFDQLSAGVDAAKNNADHTIHVACYNTFTTKWLLPRMHNLSMAYPTMSVNLSTSNELDIQRLHRYDLVILAEPMGAGVEEGVERHPLFAEFIGPVLSPELAALQSLQSASEIFKLPILKAQSRVDTWLKWTAVTKFKPPKSVKKIEYRHYNFAIEGAIRNLGVCLAPWHLVMDDIVGNRLLAPLSFIPSGLQYVALTRSPPKPVVRLFIDWLIQQASTMAEPPTPQAA